MSVSAEHLRRLVAMQVDLLKGHDVARRAEQTGPLGALYGDEGGWYPDGPARVRRMLDLMLEAWQPAAKELFKSVEPEHVTWSMRLMWGISAPPTTPYEVARMLSAKGYEVKGNTLSKWPVRILSSPEAVAWVNEYLSPSATRAGPAQPSGSRPVWTGSGAAEWPPHSEMSAVVAEARDLLGDLIDDDRMSIVPTVIRSAAARRTRVRYLTEDPGRSTFGRFLLHAVLPHWDPALLYSGFEGSRGAGGPRERRAASVVLQLFLYDLLRIDPSGPQDLALGLTEHLGIEGALSFRPHIDHPVSLELLPEGIARGVVLGRAPRATATRIAANTDAAALARALGPGILRAQDALWLCQSIQEQSDPAAKLSRAHLYLEKRRQIEAIGRLGRHGDPHLRGEDVEDARSYFALADQGVHLELLHLKAAEEVRELWEMITSHGPHYNYFTLANRNAALFANKVQNHSAAIARAFEAHQSAKRALADQERDYWESLETVHQVALASSAIFVSIVEAGITHRRRRHDGMDLDRYLIASLRWSTATVHHLADLERYLGQFPEVRLHDRQHIVWEDWLATTRQTHLRVLLAAHTALNSGAVAPNTLRGHPFDVSVDALVDAYRDLIKTTHLSDRAIANLGKQATWLAFLNGDRIPVEKEVSPAVASVGFLDGDPFSMAGAATRPFDLEASARWHNDTHDPGTLGRFAKDSLASTYLDRVSGGRYSQWRDLLHHTDVSGG